MQIKYITPLAFHNQSKISFGENREIPEKEIPNGENFGNEIVNNSKYLLLGHAINIDTEGNCYLDGKKIEPKYFAKKIDDIHVQKRKLAFNYTHSEKVLWPFPEERPSVDFFSSHVLGGNLLSNNTGNDVKIDAASKVPKTLLAPYTYDKIGGMKDVIKDIREIIESSIIQPELNERLNLQPNRNLLLSGPPGCGKTMLARTIANETGANLFVINGPELKNKWHGETEARMRVVFEQAEKSEPAIIFIDEFDSVASQRYVDGTTYSSTKNDEVNQLLTLIDELKFKNKNVFIIAATNLPEALDNATTRSGRFDTKIKIPLPNIDASFEILKIKTEKTPLAEDVNLKAVAKKCFLMELSGADIEALVDKSGIVRRRKTIENGYDKKNLASVKVHQADFEEAIAKLKDKNNYKIYREEDLC